MNRLFIDTETTGTEEGDRLLQVAFRLGGFTHTSLHNPGVPIRLMAMATHHITEEMVASEPPFAGSFAHRVLAPCVDKVLFIAHNAPFDLKMFAKEGLEFQNVVDTLKVEKYLDFEAELECYKLQYLRYLYGMKVEATAHDALGDVLVLEQLFAHQLGRIMQAEGIGEEAAVERMKEISSQPEVIRRLQFGKHKGMLVAEAFEKDRGWFEWLYKEKLKAEEQDEAWLTLLGELLGKPKQFLQ